MAEPRERFDGHSQLPSRQICYTIIWFIWSWSVALDQPWQTRFRPRAGRFSGFEANGAGLRCCDRPHSPVSHPMAVRAPVSSRSYPSGRALETPLRWTRGGHRLGHESISSVIGPGSDRSRQTALAYSSAPIIVGFHWLSNRPRCQVAASRAERCVLGCSLARTGLGLLQRLAPLWFLQPHSLSRGSNRTCPTTGHSRFDPSHWCFRRGVPSRLATHAVVGAQRATNGVVQLVRRPPI